MTGLGIWRAIECPQCRQQVFMKVPVLVPTADGTCAQDTSSLVRGISIHMRVGCSAGGRRRR